MPALAGVRGCQVGVRGLAESVCPQGASKGYQGIRGHWGLAEGVGIFRGALGSGRECRGSGASRGIEVIKGHWGLVGGIRGVSWGVGGVWVHWGWQGA